MEHEHEHEHEHLRPAPRRALTPPTRGARQPKECDQALTPAARALCARQARHMTRRSTAQAARSDAAPDSGGRTD